jgi:hypothetical protein
MADDINSCREIKEHCISVSIKHLLSGPQSVGEVLSEVNGTDDVHVPAIEGGVIENFLEEVQNFEAIIISLVDSLIRDCRLPFKPDGLAR